MRKVYAFTLLTVFIFVFFTGCNLKTISQKDKVFSKAGMSITLTDSFTEKELASQTAYYESSVSMVTALKEEFKTFEAAGISTDTSLKDYAKLVLDNNKLTGSEIIEEGGLTSFTYDKNMNGKDFTYFATVFKSNDAYWLIQFASTKNSFDTYKDDFIKWAKTVSFS